MSSDELYIGMEGDSQLDSVFRMLFSFCCFSYLTFSVHTMMFPFNYTRLCHPFYELICATGEQANINMYCAMWIYSCQRNARDSFFILLVLLIYYDKNKCTAHTNTHNMDCIIWLNFWFLPVYFTIDILNFYRFFLSRLWLFFQHEKYFDDARTIRACYKRNLCQI